MEIPYYFRRKIFCGYLPNRKKERKKETEIGVNWQAEKQIENNQNVIFRHLKTPTENEIISNDIIAGNGRIQNVCTSNKQ